MPKAMYFQTNKNLSRLLEYSRRQLHIGPIATGFVLLFKDDLKILTLPNISSLEGNLLSHTETRKLVLHFLLNISTSTIRLKNKIASKICTEVCTRIFMHL
jgi:hypothetical protein